MVVNVILGLVFIGAVIVFIKFQLKKKSGKHVGGRPPKPPKSSKHVGGRPPKPPKS